MNSDVPRSTSRFNHPSARGISEPSHPGVPFADASSPLSRSYRSYLLPPVTPSGAQDRNSARQGPGGSGETKTGLRGPGGRTPKSCSRRGFREHDFRVALRVRVAPLGASSCFSGPSWGSFGGQFWVVGGPGWAVLGLSWAVLEGSGRRGALLGPPTTLWGASGGRIGALLAAFWGSRGPS